jgi:hypothetical protein
MNPGKSTLCLSVFIGVHRWPIMFFSASDPHPPPLYNGLVPRLVLPAILASLGVLSAQSSYFPLKDVRAGMHATGRTVFSGDRVTISDPRNRSSWPGSREARWNTPASWRA